MKVEVIEGVIEMCCPKCYWWLSDLPLRPWLVFSMLSVLLIVASPTTQAGLVIMVDLDSAASGIQNSISVSQGESFSAQIILLYNDTIGIDSYRFSVNYDNTGLVASSPVHTPPVGFSEGLVGPNVAGSLVAPFNGVSDSIFNGPNSISAVSIGSIQFTAGFTTGTFTITPFEDSLFDGSFNNDGDQITAVDFHSGTVDVTSVPEPSTLVLLTIGGGVLSLGLRKRRKRSLISS